MTHKQLKKLKAKVEKTLATPLSSAPAPTWGEVFSRLVPKRPTMTIVDDPIEEVVESIPVKQYDTHRSHSPGFNSF